MTDSINKKTRALEGLKVLDFTTLLPGPYASMVLADLGAEVLHVIGPGRYDLVTHWSPDLPGQGTGGVGAWLGRNKKSLFLNLKKEGAVEVVKRLIVDYDIILEQFRPGVMAKLGLAYEDLAGVNPGLIYCSITGYGQTGPKKDRAGHDINYLAQSGIAASSGRKEGGPALYNFQIADVASGSMNALVGILAAVIHRQNTGEGQYIDIAMADGLVPFLSMDGAAFLAGEGPVGPEEGLLNGGGIYDFYETKDGGYMSVGSLEGKFFRALCRALGYPEWEDGEILKEDPEGVKAAFRATFRTKSREEWTAIFRETDACVEAVLTIDEVIKDPHYQERGVFPQVPLAIGEGQVTQLGNPIRMTKTPPAYVHAGYPEGYHSREVLSALGLSKDEIEELSSR